jgi:hypothetical protein
MVIGADCVPARADRVEDVHVQLVEVQRRHLQQWKLRVCEGGVGVVEEAVFSHGSNAISSPPEICFCNRLFRNRGSSPIDLCHHFFSRECPRLIERFSS